MDKELQNFIIKSAIDIILRYENLVKENDKNVEYKWSFDPEFVEFSHKMNKNLLEETSLVLDGLNSIIDSSNTICDNKNDTVSKDIDILTAF